MRSANDTRQQCRVEMLPPDQTASVAAEVGVPPELTDRNLFRVLLHRPRVAKAINELLYAQLFDAALDGRLRELVIMRLGWVTGCDYEWTQHWTVAQSVFGCTPEDLLAVRDWRESKRFGEAERAVLRATDETIASGTLSTETWALCRRHLGSPDACVELVTAIATWHFISQVARSLEIPVEEGVASWPPDGVAPVGAGGR
jgi:alkylhydroperoxidase family enzyme